MGGNSRRVFTKNVNERVLDVRKLKEVAVWEVGEQGVQEGSGVSGEYTEQGLLRRHSDPLADSAGDSVKGSQSYSVVYMDVMRLRIHTTVMWAFTSRCALTQGRYPPIWFVNIVC